VDGLMTQIWVATHDLQTPRLQNT